MSPTSKRQAILYLTAIFLVGLITGGAIGFSAGKRSVFGPPRPEKMAAQIQARLKAELQLTDEQMTNIAPVVEASVAQMSALHRNSFERGAEIIKETNRRIEAFLTPEQRQKHAEQEKRREESFRKHIRLEPKPR